MSAREQILGNVRAATGDMGPPPAPFRMRRRRTGLSRAGVVALFGQRLAEAHATVRHVGTDEFATAMAAMLWARDAKRVAVPGDLPEAWIAGLDEVRVVADAPRLEHSALAETDAVITGCALAVAETGTVVLDGGRAQGRRALTLVPRHHLCVVHIDQIVDGVAEALAHLDPYLPLSWIGGVPEHRTLEVLLLED